MACGHILAACPLLRDLGQGSDALCPRCLIINRKMIICNNNNNTEL